MCHSYLKLPEGTTGTLGTGRPYQGFESAPNHLIFNKKKDAGNQKKTKQHTAAYLNEPNYNHQLIN